TRRIRCHGGRKLRRPDQNKIHRHIRNRCSQGEGTTLTLAERLTVNCQRFLGSHASCVRSLSSWDRTHPACAVLCPDGLDMNASLQELMQRISEMRDDELLAMVHSDHPQYRLEALVYAKAEIDQRGLTCGGPIMAGNAPMPPASMTAFCHRLAQAIGK